MILTSIPDKKHYQIAIIGSGPAGMSAALTIANKSAYNIAVIESGDLDYNASIYKLSEVTAEGRFRAGYYPKHAQRLFGGTSSVWAGFCTTLEERSFLNDEWPISYQDIAPYYQDAADILDLPEQAWQQPTMELPSTRCIVYKPFYLSPPVRFGVKYRRLIETHPRIDLITRHTCVGVEKEKAHINAIQLRPSTGGTATVLNADAFIFACGGIGNAKLLLNTKLAAQSPVGNYFMEHPHLYNAVGLELDREAVHAMLDSSGKRVHALQLANDVCLESSVLGMSVQFDTRFTSGTTLLGKKIGTYKLRANLRAEMRPQIKNRITLSARKDELAQAKAHINFHFNYAREARRTWDLFARELVKSGLGRASIVRASEQHIAGGGHYIGTTRMGKTPDDSVVDANCKVHGIDNLYIAGSSVFPATGVANPTFSIVAFAVRLGEHLTKHAEI